jgi:hypothetical protein
LPLGLCFLYVVAAHRDPFIPGLGFPSVRSRRVARERRAFPCAA